ncbi:hypothetical protein JRQ81_013929 [Phrynocephalus forsythii]|uniref:DDE Tnp4 domain-containing protein n=1 Tax=Phrynocephalus forsythii TaxID=171643 RepID=A0A9Q0XVQ7_9SAUR|nr:hypothetical protein JRQ81_013929 [Phrynocephalus forsythii]
MLFEIADVLRPYLMQRDTVMCSAIPVEERVAIGVYFLASCSCYRTIAHVFQKGTSTIMLFSMRKHGFPHCIGAGDGSHVPITPPKKEAACDGDGIFFSMLAGHSGVNHDGHVFRSSLLYRKMEEGTLILGNPMFQYGGGVHTTSHFGRWNDRERHYNKVSNRTRNIVEHTFGRLKARFCRLSVCMEAHIQNVNSIIASAVILHNICEKKKHFIPDEDTEFQNTPPTAEIDVPDLEPTRGATDRMEAEAIRSAIANYLFTHVK